MTKQFKSKRDKRPPLEFELVYDKKIKVERDDGSIDEEYQEQTTKFRARPGVPGTLMLRIARAMKKSNDLESIGVAASELMDLLEKAIWPEDKKAFFELLDDPETMVELETLAEILEWLAEQYAENPTSKP